MSLGSEVGIVSLSVSFKFSDSYSQIIPDAATKTSLQIYIRPQLADMMNVTLTRITDVSLSQGMSMCLYIYIYIYIYIYREREREREGGGERERENF